MQKEQKTPVDELGFYAEERKTRQRKIRNRIAGKTPHGKGDATLFAGLDDIPADCIDFVASDAVQALRKQVAFLEQRKLVNPYLRECHPLGGGLVRVDSRELIHFSGYDYLGLARDARVVNAAKAAIDEYGTTVSASRVASGNNALHTSLERDIADFLGTEDSMIFISGYGTNVTVIDHLFGPGDLLILDDLAHNSLLAGCESSGAKFLRYRHNDLDSLANALKRNRLKYRRVLIVTEGVFSMEGSQPPLDRIVELKREYKAMLMIDEAHSLGAIGATGRGITEVFGVAPGDIDIWMGTLSKSFASTGGFIAGSWEMMRYLRYTTPGFIFSVGLGPAECAAARESLRILRSEPWRVQKLAENANRLRDGFKARGWDIGGSHGSSVVPLVQGNTMKTIRLAQAMFEEGVNVHPILFPAVAENQTRLRFFVSAAHSTAQIDKTIAAAERCTEALGL